MKHIVFELEKKNNAPLVWNSSTKKVFKGTDFSPTHVVDYFFVVTAFAILIKQANKQSSFRQRTSDHIPIIEYKLLTNRNTHCTKYFFLETVSQRMKKTRLE